MINRLKRFGECSRRQALAATFIATGVAFAGLSGVGRAQPTNGALNDEYLRVVLQTGWSGHVVYGEARPGPAYSAQLIFAPFSLPADVGHVEGTPRIPGHSFVVTIFDYGYRQKSWPTADTLHITVSSVRKQGGPRPSARAVDRYRYRRLSIVVIVDFAEGKPAANTIAAVNHALSRIRLK